MDRPLVLVAVLVALASAAPAAAQTGTIFSSGANVRSRRRFLDRVSADVALGPGERRDVALFPKPARRLRRGRLAVLVVTDSSEQPAREELRRARFVLRR